MALTQNVFSCQKKTPSINNQIAQLLYAHAADNIQKLDEQTRITILRDSQTHQEKKGKEEILKANATIIQALSTNSPHAQEYLKNPYIFELYSDALITNKQSLIHLFKRYHITFNSLPTQYQLHIITQAYDYENYVLLNSLRKNSAFTKKITSLPLNIQDYINRIFEKASQFFD